MVVRLYHASFLVSRYTVSIASRREECEIGNITKVSIVCDEAKATALALFGVDCDAI